ncbi:MAG: hypothetical protein ACR2PF_07510 [Rhizobiaceae bacterium]
MGTVLGALGSAAVVRHKAIIITGGAALGLVLGWFLSGEIDKERKGQFGKFAQIQVRGLPNNARVAMIADSSFFHRERGFAAARLRFHELIATEN